MKPPLVPAPISLAYGVALVSVLLTATYPAMTRPSFVGALTSADLLALRVGVAALLFAPYLAWNFRRVPAGLWTAGIPLSFFQGWGMAAIVIGGLQFAPASHASSLGPGTLSASVAVLGLLAYGLRPHRMQWAGIAMIVAGVVAVVAGSLGSREQLLGDGLFVVASLFGAVYLLSVQQYKLPVFLTAAIVSTYSALFVLPWYLLFATSNLHAASAFEIGTQVVVQGVIRGCVCFLAVTYAISKIGSQSTSLLYALVPAIGLVSSMAIAGDASSWMDWLAVVLITAGVVAGVLFRPADSGRTARPEPRRTLAARIISQPRNVLPL